MRILSIDTSTPAGSVAISDGDRLLAQEQQGVAGTHADRLLASVDHLLHICGLEQEDIEAVAVAIGPGSFTGLRIGLATAKGFCLARGLPVAGVSSLASLALNGREFSGTVVSLIDARRGEIYAAAWSASARGKMRPVMKECVAAPAAVAAMLKKLKGELLLVGDGAIEYGAALLKSIGKRARMAYGTQLLPQAANLAELARPRLENGRCDDLASLVPNYVRRSDAEIGFMGKK